MFEQLPYSDVAALTDGVPQLILLAKKLSAEAADHPAHPGPMSMSPLEALAAVHAIEGSSPTDDEKLMFAVIEKLGWSGAQIEQFIVARSSAGIV